MSDEATPRPFMVWYQDDGLDPLPVKATSRAEAFRIGERYRGATPTAAVDEDGGESFDDISDGTFVTEEDV